MKREEEEEKPQNFHKILPKHTHKPKKRKKMP